MYTQVATMPRPPISSVLVAGVWNLRCTLPKTDGKTLSRPIASMMRARPTIVAWVAARTEATTASAIALAQPVPVNSSATNTAALVECCSIASGGATVAKAKQISVYMTPTR